MSVKKEYHGFSATEYATATEMAVESPIRPHDMLKVNTVNEMDLWIQTAPTGDI